MWTKENKKVTDYVCMKHVYIYFIIIYNADYKMYVRKCKEMVLILPPYLISAPL